MMIDPRLHDLMVNLARQIDSPSASADNASHEIAADYLPDFMADSCQQISRLLDETERQRKVVSDELFQCYTILNTSFDATVEVAGCLTTRQAIETLCAKIAQAIQTQYAFFLGPLASHFDQRFSLGQDPTIPASNLTQSPADRDQAQAFLQANQTELLNLLQEEESCVVRMIDFKGKTEMDHAGRGNVMFIRLSGNHDELSRSSLLFIRDNGKEPFIAVEMNMAATLARMCSAVMSNIIYAQKLKDAFIQTISALVRAMEAKDHYTCGHSNRVSEIACHLGRFIGLDDDHINQLEWAGLLHDIGKIGIHEDILCKPGRLTEEEYAIIKSHPETSFKVLEPVAALKDILPAVRHHHEHFDGSGYPDKLTGDAIPRLARIIQIADIWDALTSTRSYRKAMPHEKAIAIFHKESGTTMDPYLVERFLAMIQEHPQWVCQDQSEGSNGELGNVPTA